MTIQELAHKTSISSRISVLLFLFLASLAIRAASQAEDPEWYYKQYANTPIEEVYQQGMTHLKNGETVKALACLTVVTGRYHDKMSDKERKVYEYALNNAGAINQKVVIPLLKEFLDTAEIDEKGNVNGLEEQIKQIKESEDTKFLFKETINTIQGKVPGETLDTPINAKPDFKNMTYEQICEAMQNKQI